MSMEEAAAAIRAAEHVVFFTGAGVSSESGIDTFRDQGGLWSQFPPERFATVKGLMTVAATSPRELARFIEAVLRPVAEATPNDGHRAMAGLQDDRRVTVITQNVDRLHQAAGSRAVYEVHGNLFDVVNSNGKILRTLSRETLLEIAGNLRTVDLEGGRTSQLAVMRAVKPLLGLSARGLYRPRLVLFGEGMAEPDWTEAQRAAAACDVMFVVGTSGEVWPAAALPELARKAGATVFGVGPEELGTRWIIGTSATVLPELVALSRAL